MLNYLKRNVWMLWNIIDKYCIKHTFTKSLYLSFYVKMSQSQTVRCIVQPYSEVEHGSFSEEYSDEDAQVIRKSWLVLYTERDTDDLDDLFSHLRVNYRPREGTSEWNRPFLVDTIPFYVGKHYVCSPIPHE